MTCDMMGCVTLTLLDQLTQSSVLSSAAATQKLIDEFLLLPVIRRPSAATAVVIAQLRESSALGSAELSGIALPAHASDAVRGDGSPMAMQREVVDALVAAAVADADMFMTSPPRALARWHMIATAGLHLPDASRGRPRLADEPVFNDPLNCSIAAAPVDVTMTSLLKLALDRSLPALVVASALHALVAHSQPFNAANALLARTAARAALVARASDPDGLIPVERAIADAGRSKYVQQLRGCIVNGVITVQWWEWQMHMVAAAVERATMIARRDSASQV